MSWQHCRDTAATKTRKAAAAAAETTTPRRYETSRSPRSCNRHPRDDPRHPHRHRHQPIIDGRPRARPEKLARFSGRIVATRERAKCQRIASGDVPSRIHRYSAYYRYLPFVSSFHGRQRVCSSPHGIRSIPFFMYIIIARVPFYTGHTFVCAARLFVYTQRRSHVVKGTPTAYSEDVRILTINTHAR